MKKRNAFICVILSFIPLGNPLFIKTGVVLSTAKIVIFNSESAIAESIEFYKNSGNDKLDNKDYKGAISDFTEAIKISSKDGDAYKGRGVAKSFLGNDKGAISDLTEAIRINPEDGDAYVYRGFSKISIDWNNEGCSDLTMAKGLESSYIKDRTQKFRIVFKKNCQ